MSNEPQIEAGRERFKERVALALEVTWQGYGFAGPDFTPERAGEMAEAIAECFPLMPRLPVLTIDEDALREALKDYSPLIGQMTFRPNSVVVTYGYGGRSEDDGVVGD